MQPEGRGAAGFFDGLEWVSPDNEGLPIRRLRREEGADTWKQTERRKDSPLALKRTRGVSLYPQERLYQEMAFLAYYLHWSDERLMELDHFERRRWCREVSAINKKLSGDDKRSIEFR